jgi:hypothetical protein
VEEARGDAGLKALLALGAAGLLIAGCGDSGGAGSGSGATTAAAGPASSKPKYEHDFKALLARADSAPPIQLPKGASLAQQADGIDKGLQRARALASALAALEPPAEVRHAQDLFVSGLRRFAADGEKVAAALRAGDEPAARKLLGPNGGALDPTAIQQVTAARREFASKGYDLGGVSHFP